MAVPRGQQSDTGALRDMRANLPIGQAFVKTNTFRIIVTTLDRTRLGDQPFWGA